MVSRALSQEAGRLGHQAGWPRPRRCATSSLAPVAHRRCSLAWRYARTRSAAILPCPRRGRFSRPPGVEVEQVAEDQVGLPGPDGRRRPWLAALRTALAGMDARHGLESSRAEARWPRRRGRGALGESAACWASAMSSPRQSRTCWTQGQAVEAGPLRKGADWARRARAGRPSPHVQRLRRVAPLRPRGPARRGVLAPRS